jgi:single-stranded DNA-binding protein
VNGLTGCCTGKLGGDAELRYTRDGRPFVSFTLAVDQKDPEAETQWLKVVRFGVEEDLVPKLVKGASAYAEGYVKLNRWEAPDGSPRSGLELVAWQLTVMGAIGRRAPAQARRQGALQEVARAAQEIGEPLPF